MPLDRFDIFVDFDGFTTIEQNDNGDFVKAADAPAGLQRYNMVLWDAGTMSAFLEEEEDNDGDWVRFEDIK
jgi:hypothetical protein